jgi:hypothetical protein
MTQKNKKFNYLFFIYGSKRIKGVQTKAINIINFLPREEVLIINHGDSTWLEKHNLPVINLNYNRFFFPTNTPEDIKLKEYIDSAKVIIFCDFPTNMSLPSLIFWYVYKNLKKPICVFDNIYNTKQFKEKLYNIFYHLADLILLTGINYFQSYLKKFKKAVLIPPFFEAYNQDTSFYRNKVAETFKIKNKERKNILYIAYNEKVFNFVKKMISKIDFSDINHLLITPSHINDDELSLLREKNKENIYLIKEKLNQNEIRDLILASDIVITKFGYQQVLEVLSLQKPLITVADSGLKKNWLDKNIANTFPFFPKFNYYCLNYFKKLIKDEIFYKKIVSKIEKLHNNEFNGAKIAASEIIKLKNKKITKRFSPQKTLIIAFNTKKNIQKVKKVIEKEIFALPIIISNRFAERDFDYPKGKKPLLEKLENFNFCIKDEIINNSFSFILNFSPIAYHGFSMIYPYLDQISKLILNLMERSDKIYFIGPETRAFFYSITKSIKNYKNKLIKFLDN